MTAPDKTYRIPKKEIETFTYQKSWSEYDQRVVSQDADYARTFKHHTESQMAFELGNELLRRGYIEIRDAPADPQTGMSGVRFTLMAISPIGMNLVKEQNAEPVSILIDRIKKRVENLGSYHGYRYVDRLGLYTLLDEELNKMIGEITDGQ